MQGKDRNVCCCLPFWKVKRKATERVKKNQTKGGRTMSEEYSTMSTVNSFF